MAFDIVIKPIVIFDAEDAAEYYNKKASRLGQRFYACFLSFLKNIETKPFTFSYVAKSVRRCKITDFPYIIYYTINGQYIFILRAAHAKRSNAFVRKRLGLL